VDALQPCERLLQGSLDVLGLRDRNAAEPARCFGLGLQFGLLALEHVGGHEVVVEELDQLFLLRLDLRERAFVGFGFFADQRRTVAQLAS
jgi:hypothetical protein